MVLQSVILPSEVCNDEELYYRKKGSVCCKNGVLFLTAGTEVTTDTYMNFFDYVQWGRFTDVEDFAVSVVFDGEAKVLLVDADKKYYLWFRAVSNVKIYDIHFETLESRYTNSERSSRNGKLTLEENAGNKTSTHNLYIQAGDAVKG